MPYKLVPSLACYVTDWPEGQPTYAFRSIVKIRLLRHLADVPTCGASHSCQRCNNDAQNRCRLCRYIIRPALANDRVKINAKGQVELKLKTPWRDGTTHHVMSPLEFMQRLAALVPRPRLHLIRFHGVLAPNAKWRSNAVPQAPISLSH
jgi:Putative transposase